MFTRSIKPNTTDSHQTSPAYLLTFVRWDNRDVLNNSDDNMKTRQPLVVYNDAISVQVSFSKASLAPTFQSTLVSGDINYSTAVHPGDFVFVNMVNWYDKAEELRNRAVQSQPINKVTDGFKGVFKIQSVTRQLSITQEGIKVYRYQITGAGFTELNTVIVYNPVLQGKFAQKAFGFYPALLGKYFSNESLQIKNISELIQDLYSILLGHSKRSSPENVNSYGNSHYKIPADVAKLLGVPEAKYVNEVYNLITGVWGSSSNAKTLSKGFNPQINPTSEQKNIYKTSSPMQGAIQIMPQDWNNKTVSSIFHQYLNSVLNEMYVCYRVSPDKESIMPTIIARQKPFNNPRFKPLSGKEDSFTKFTELPRWKLEPEMLLSSSLSTNEALRVNFVQVFTRNLAALDNVNLDKQISVENFKTDDKDIERNGLKPYIVTAQFDFPSETGGRALTDTLAKEWTELVADWVINGHLKESGTLSCVGIEDPIAVGDNLEFDGVVYHIESINHAYQQTQTGAKMFRTQITVSFGIDTRTTTSTTYYPEMQHTDRYTKGQEDFENSRILPGFSDTQDIIGRVNGEEVKETKQKFFQTPRRRR